MRMNSQGLGRAPTGTSMRVGPSRCAKALAQGLAQFRRTCRAHRHGAEAFRELDEIRVGEVVCDLPAEALLLDAADVAEGAVVEQHRDQRNTMAHRGRHFGCREHEAAVAGDRQHRHVAPGILRAERGGKAVAQIVLIAGRQEGARPIHRKGEPRGEAELCHLVDKNAVLRQLGANCRKIVELRRELRQPLAHAVMAFAHLVGARWPARVVGRQKIEQSLQDRPGIPDQRDLWFGDARRRFRIHVDGNDSEVAIEAPLQERHVQMRTDAEHHVRFGPQFVAERQVDRKRIAIAQHAAAAAIGENRRLQQMRQLRHFGCRVERSAAGDDQRPLGGAQPLGGGLECVFVDRRGAER